jgi:hypothetical protein
MKKFFSAFIIVFLLSCCFSIVGCDSRYSNLIISAQLDYSSTETTTLDDGTIRVSSQTGTFDVNVDGSYTFYIEDSTSSYANLDVLFENAPGDFSYDTAFNVSNPVVKLNSTYEYIEDGIRTKLTATSAGQADIQIISVESNKSTTVKVAVKQVADSIDFANDDLAITSGRNSSVSLADQLVFTPTLASVDSDSVSYQFGQFVDDNFVAYTDAQMVSNGLNFNSNTLNLSVISNVTSLSQVAVQAVYDNPLGSDLVATTTINVVSAISDVEIYSGSSTYDISSENLLPADETQNFVVNFDKLNYKDIILKVNSNGEEVSFSYVESNILPFEISCQDSKKQVVYLDDSNQTTTAESATYAVFFYRLVASKGTTTTNSSYPDGTFTLQFECNYASYTVEGYPLTQNYIAKCFNLIKQFSINNTTMESVSAGDDSFKNDSESYLDSCYDENLYLNTEDSVAGESFKIGVATPSNVLSDDSKFTLEVYDSSSNAVASPLEVLSISYKINSSSSTIKLNNMSTEFGINTILYIKINPSKTLTVGTVYYVVVRAVEPEGNESQAVATIHLTVTQGIEGIASYDYSYLYREIDEETGEYGTDYSGSASGNITFENYVSSQALNLELGNNLNSLITFNVLPDDASLENLTMTSSNKTILTVEKVSGSNGYLITTNKIGSATITVSCSNLSTTYSISVNVYKPIDSMTVSLVDSSLEAGVGAFEEDSSGSLTSATLQVNNTVYFSLSILPLNVSQYSTLYTVTKTSDGVSSAVGSYQVNMDGTKSGNAECSDAELTFNFSKMSCLFKNTETSGDIYTINITLTNVNGVTKVCEFVLSSYVPVASMSISLPVTTVYNPNTISFQSRVSSLDDVIFDGSVPTNDPTIFGVAVDVTSSTSGTTTYSFLNNGTLTFYVNNVKDSEYYCASNGILTKKSSSSSIATLLSNTSWNGYFWFKLNENYTYSSVRTFAVNAQIKELNYYLSKDKLISVVSATTSSSIFVDADAVSDYNYQMTFKKDFLTQQTQTLQLKDSTSYNNNLLYLVLNEFVEDGSTYYAIAQEGKGLVDVELTSTGIQSQYTMSVNANSSYLDTAYLLVIPQDKILTSEQNDLWTNSVYVKVSVDESSFESGLYYTLSGGVYTIAEEFTDGVDYYIQTKNNLENLLSIWSKMLVFKIIVQNGDNSPYYISTLSELQQICVNEPASTKNYILTKDISVSSNGDWQTIGTNYYEADVSGELADDDYYVLNDGNYVLADMSGNFDTGLTYYRTGFNGTLSGKYVVTSITGEVLSTSYYGIKNIIFNGEIDEENYSVVAKLGSSGSINNLSVTYEIFQPTFDESLSSFTFGGVVGENYGTIENVKVTFNNTIFSIDKTLVFGGIAGENYGTINQNENNIAGVKGSVSITLFDSENDYYIGGLVGKNFGTITGKYDLNDTVDYTFSDAGFDSSLVLKVSSDTGNVITSTNIGGVAGISTGTILNVSVQGKIVAPLCDNVGGLVGYVTYVADDTQTFQYDLANSYSIISISAYDNVGGAVGKIVGESAGSKVVLYNVSAENYSSNYLTSNNYDRNFVSAHNNVGGLIGYANFLNLTYSYVISYYDCSSVTTNIEQDYNYDVVGNDYVAGLIGKFENTDIGECATNLNLKSATANSSLFVFQDDIECTLANAFAIGSIYAEGGDLSLGFGGDITGLSYSCVYDVKNAKMVYYLNGSVTTGGTSAIIADYNSASYADMWNIDTESNLNSGLPYLQIVDGDIQQALFASSSINISVSVKDNEGNTFKNYIKNSENTLVLYYNYDKYGNYKSSTVSALNQISIDDILDIIVYPQTSKTSRIEVYSSNSGVISFDDEGNLTLVGTGEAKITFVSKLNSNYYKDIYVYVINGLTSVKVEASGSTLSIDGKEIEILKSLSRTLNIETGYTVQASSTESLSLTSFSSIGIRFEVSDEDWETAIGDGTENISDVLWIGNKTWQYDTENKVYYIEVNAGDSLSLKPQKALESGASFDISYYPYIKANFNSVDTKIFLNDYAGTFSLQIITGATDIVFENNISQITINQLQVAVVDVTITTDYSQDVIMNNFDELQAENSNFGFTISGYTYYPNQANVESISMTYTIWYKDKTSSIDGSVNFALEFWASSALSIKKTLNVTITGFSVVNGVDLTIYDELDDFPQQANDQNVIYNGEEGLLSVEVYPYFAKYDTLELSYETTSGKALSITQISYDVSGSSGDKWNSYEDSGAVIQSDGSLLVQKTSGQDTYQINTDNKYSYSKSYFFALNIGSDVPNNSQFVITIKILSSNGTVISTNEITVNTLSQPIVGLSFDDSLLGTDGKYYLPYNTTHTLNVDVVNFSGDISWQISAVTDYTLTTAVTEALTPVLSNGQYSLSTLSYSSTNSEVNDPYVIGNEFQLVATVSDGQIDYQYSLNFVITLFTVTGVSVQDVSDGALTLASSTTTPLKVTVSVDYDSTVSSSDDNWYSVWYDAHSDDSSDALYKKIVASGYEIKETFQDYITILKENIAKAKYDTSSSTISGVFSYVNDDNVVSYLTLNKKYNDTTFLVENYKNYFAVVGLKINKYSTIRYDVQLSYYSTSSSQTGIPNVNGYDVEVTTTYKHTFEFTDDFSLDFVFKTDLINYIPVSTASEFLSMQAGYSYRLVADIELANYSPIEASISTFDGNNYTIYVTGFSYSESTSSECCLSLFTDIPEDTTIMNTTVCYTSKVTSSNGDLTPSSTALSVTYYQTEDVTFGGIACENNGVITNCEVTGGLSLTLGSVSSGTATVETELNGGLVTTNSSTGYITNSRVKDFSLICYGETGGFVGENYGKIVSCYFDSSSVSNLSSDSMGGFAYSNSSAGSIYECYSQGVRSDDDRDIRNTGDGLASYGGDIAGFIYKNEGAISDCYSNIKISSSSSMAGFFYIDTASSVISRCYSTSYKNPNDNSTTAFPFAGPLSTSISPRVEIKGTLNNCFYLSSSESWKVTDFFISDSSDASETPDTKLATPLSFDNFATHTSFTNFDLSLVYSTGDYADSTTSEPDTFNYVDGYTWVIIEGKPELVSTLTQTVSMSEYLGKTKNYSYSYTYYDITSQALTIGVTKTSGNKQTTVYYGTDSATQEKYELYTITVDTSLKTLTYVFPATDEQPQLTIYYDITNGVNSPTLISAESGEDDVEILDVETTDEEELTASENFRASDTIIVEYDEDGNITKITYKVLESASYSYASNYSGVSDVQGTRTNPYIIYDYDTFCNYLSASTTQNFYRIVKDIDIDDNFVSTVHSSFQGVLQGNYMNIENISLSYLNSKIESGFDADSFGLFASITTVPDDVLDTNESFDTVISNLNLLVDQVVSNAHKFVGALAGRIGPSIVIDSTTGEESYDSQSSGQKIFLNNISIDGINDQSAYVQGKNAVGGLAGIVTGKVVIKDITSTASVNATYEISNSLTDEMLYTTEDSVDYIAYAGGVVGIFDVTGVVDSSTLKNYNASNIFVDGNNYYIGNIVGSVFGLVGQNAIVNYANVAVTYSQSSFIKSTSYSGGLAGENRGTIISSSIYYDEETEEEVSVGYSFYTEYNYFYNSSRYVSIADGGLVGLNNGGTISNSISSINVRNKKSLIAGGAVGRMIEGTLSNVIAGGSVISKSIMGGLIGTLNDVEKIVEDGDYNANAILKLVVGDTSTTKMTYQEFLDNSVEETNLKTTVIENCVSATNWLFADYDYYESILSSVGCVGGFIGLVCASTESEEVETRMNEFVDFSSQSFYSNTLYQTNTSIVNDYLQPIYTSTTIDSYNSAVVGDPITLEDSDGNQSVFAYATTSFYNDVNMSSVTYKVRVQTNANATSANTADEDDKYMSKIYTITSSSPTTLSSDSQFYSAIDSKWTTETSERTYSWYTARFGNIYYKRTDDDGNEKYTLVSTQSSFDTLIASNASEVFYYISASAISNFEYSKTYLSDYNDIIFYGSEATLQKGSDGHSFTTLADFKKQTSISLNGLYIPLDTSTILGSDETLEDESTFTGITYTYPSINLSLPDGGVITSLSFVITSYYSGVTKWFSVESLTLNYSYENITSSSSSSIDQFVTLKVSSSNSVLTYTLMVSSKKVIYHSFENGYWVFDDSFLSTTYSTNGKFPTNEELADIYVWSSFITPFTAGNEIITEINSAEDLASLAYSVNVLGHDYDGITVFVNKDIDLSGKYWVPIGNETTAFKGTLSGGNHSIKYASVDENSLYSSSNTTVEELPTYAGLFGIIQNATIKNLVIIGGEFYGENAGGVAGLAIDSTILNVENRNTIIGTVTAGGLVGVLYSTGDASITNSAKYGEVKVANTSTTGNAELYLGGLVGKINDEEEIELSSTITLSTVTISGNTNNGKLSLSNKLTNYTSGNSNKVSIFVGGLAGYLTQVSFDNENKNYGDITVKTNAHTIYTGGAVGLVADDSTSSTLSKLKNDSTITMTYENSYVDLDEWQAVCYVGGVAGYSSQAVSLASCAGEIDFYARRGTLANIAVGGIVGCGESGISQSYNIAEINLTTSDSSTTLNFGGIAGLVNLKNSSLSILNSYNNGAITANNISKLFVAGIVGRAVNGESGNVLTISDCLNTGDIVVQSINETRNALGAIVGVDDFLYTGFVSSTDSTQDVYLRNYYLRGSAFSGTDTYSAYCSYDTATSSYVATSDTSTFADAQTSSDLKDTSVSYTDWDFDTVWQQDFDTWFPTLKQNNVTNMWTDNTKEVSSANKVYIIKTAEQLAYIATQVNSGLLSTKNVTFQLKKQIDLANKYWTPIGNADYPFSGTFNGDGYVIKNLTIDGDTLEDSTYGGLFGVVEDATITNFGLESVIVTNVSYASAVAFSVENSSVTKVFTEKGDSEESSVEGTYGAGGLIYQMINDEGNLNSTCSLKYSYNNINVVGTITLDDTQIVGGLVGTMQNSTISNCYNGEDAVIKRHESTGADNGILVVGQVDENCEMDNVFNLSSTIISNSGTNASSTPKLFYINTSSSTPTVSASTTTPLYVNLTATSGEDLSEIWTEEYSLHEDDFSVYPSLRGLGQNWKNTESDTLLNFEKDSTTSITTLKNEVKEEIETLATAGTIQQTLVSFASDNTTLTISKIYLISTAEELSWLATNVNNGTISTSGSEFMLVSDIDLSGKYWTPIGSSSSTAFSGIFNFNGHVISGLMIDSDSLAYGGLFGYTSGATIINGYIDGAFIKINCDDSTTKVYAGALVGFAENTSISNVSVSADIMVTSKASTYVGGLVGLYTGSAGFQMQNVHIYQTGDFVELGNYADMVGEEDGSIDATQIDIAGISTNGVAYVGGVAGYISGYTTTGSDYIVEYAENEANVAGVSTSNSSNVYAGGLVGYGTTFSINASHSSGNVKTYSSKYDIVGGLIGFCSNSRLSNLYFDTGIIESRQTTGRDDSTNDNIWSYVGGIVGWMKDGYIRYCVSVGLTSNSQNSDMCVGAIIGKAEGKTFDLTGGDAENIYSTTNTGFSTGIGIYDDTCVITSPLDTVFLTDFSLLLDSTKFSETYWDSTTSKLNAKKIYLTSTGDILLSAYKPISTSLDKTGLFISSFDENTVAYSQYTFQEGDQIGIATVKRNLDGKLEYNYTLTALTAMPEDGYNLSSFVSIDSDEDVVVCFVTIVRTSNV